MDVFDQIIVDNAKKDPDYRPYCLRCRGLIRMFKVVPFYWKCSHCPAECDLRKEAALDTPKNT